MQFCHVLSGTEPGQSMSYHTMVLQQFCHLVKRFPGSDRQGSRLHVRLRHDAKLRTGHTSHRQKLSAQSHNLVPFTHTGEIGITQAEIYEDSVAPLVGSYVKGYNATILAYGQTVCFC